MSEITFNVDAMEVTKRFEVHLHLHRFTEWKVRQKIGFALVRLGLRLTGISVIVKFESDDSIQIQRIF